METFIKSYSDTKIAAAERVGRPLTEKAIAALPEEAKKKWNNNYKPSYDEGKQLGSKLLQMKAECENEWFNFEVNTASGNPELLKLILHGMNETIREKQTTEETAEETAEGLAKEPKEIKTFNKMLFSAGDTELLIIADVSNGDPTPWLNGVISSVNGTINENIATVIPNSQSTAFKDRDMLISLSYAYLKKQGLIPDDESDEDVDYSAFLDA